MIKIKQVLLRALHKLASRVLRGGKFSFSFAGTDFLNASDAKSLFKEHVFYEGDKSHISVPALTRDSDCFFGNKGDHFLEDAFLGKRFLNINSPFSLRIVRKQSDRFFEAEGTLLIQKKGRRILLAPEFRASLNLLTPFRQLGGSATSERAVFSSWRSFTYGDFGLLMLPKWARLKHHCDTDREFRPSINIPPVPFMHTWANEFGLKSDQQTLAKKKLHEVQREATLLYGPGVLDGFICAPSDLALLRKFVIPKLKNNGQRHLYISRQGRRKPLNQDEVECFLNAKGFLIVEDMPRSVFEQAEMYFNAAVIVAPHGASLANLAFSRTGTKVFEFLPGRYASETYRRLSAINSLKYSCMICGALGTHKDAAVQEDYRVDIPLLNFAIEKLLKES